MHVQNLEYIEIKEQKTGKFTNLPVSKYVFECIDIYCIKTEIDPIEHINEYVFSFPAKTAWIERKGDIIYKENNLDKWCEWLDKDFSDKRKNIILEEFDKQKKYKKLVWEEEIVGYKNIDTLRSILDQYIIIKQKHKYHQYKRQNPYESFCNEDHQLFFYYEDSHSGP